MTDTLKTKVNLAGIRGVIVMLASVMILLPASIRAEVHSAIVPSNAVRVLQEGETLTYNISWSNIFTAGIAVLKAESEMLPEGKSALSFVIAGHSTGLVEELFHVHDVARSIFDPHIEQSLSFNIQEVYGKKQRRRELVFNPEHRTVIRRLNDDAPETFPVPENVLDPLSALYVIRMIDDFTIGKNTVISVFENDKNWSVEIQVLGKEKVKTPAGEFNAIKLRTYPRYQGVFLNKGVVFLWLSDDNRKIPVLIKSSLKVGSFILTLTEIQPGGEAR
jgi:uncharacterized protein DUF3108